MRAWLGVCEDGRFDVNLTDGYGRSPLSYAAEGGYEGMVNLLLETGHASINLRDSKNLTPLSYAVQNESEAVIKLLQSVGSR